MNQGELDFGGPSEKQPAAPRAAPSPKETPSEPKVLHLIDASGYVFRAYHALPGLTTSRGLPTSAVLGFTRMLLKSLRELSPTHLALCFDKEGRRGRLEIDPSYKANRAATPEDLLVQFELIRKVAHALNLPTLEFSGWEADDVIATVAKKAKQAGFKVRIIASDKDFVQLLDPEVELYDPVRDRVLRPQDALQHYQVNPSQMVDYLALIGDAIDNVAKVPGIGPKTAVELLQQFGDIDGLLARVEEVKKPKVRQALTAHTELLRRARELVRLRSDLPLEVEIEQLRRRPIRDAEARVLFTELEFFRLLQEMPSPPPTALAHAATVVGGVGDLEALAAELRKAGEVWLIPAYRGAPLSAGLVGLGLALPEGRSFYLPLGHLRAPVLPAAEVKRALGPLFADGSLKKSGHDLKALLHLLSNLGLELSGAHGDVQLLSYLLNPSRKEHALSDLARERLGAELPAHPGERKELPLAEAEVEEVAAFVAASADAAQRLSPLLWDEAEHVGLSRVAREIELPLLPVLARMERAGIKVDLAVLAEVSRKVEAACQERLAETYRLAGRELNVGSPAQLAQVLYGELKLPVLKKGKTGPSTDQEVLEKLAQQHPLPRAILEYRNVAKLKSTYLDPLPSLVAADGRVHTTFQQTATATGRLSSTDPNLQNIPIRNELGREIRSAFVAEQGQQLISADYSQIELRILAHIAGDRGLLQAFGSDADVHTQTAAEVFAVRPEEVTLQMRRAAKMVNYGIAYGLSSHGLATRLDIPTEEAQSIIDRYFQRYAGIHRYLEETIAQAHRNGFVESLFGRRRYLPELGSANRGVAMAAERAAINMPIQGTAADLIKLAMIRLERALGERKLGARMLLQVHDELVFEAPLAEVEETIALARELMSSAAELQVPLKVDVRAGHSWAEAH